MRIIHGAATGLVLALAGCGGGGGNQTVNQANIAAQEGIPDLNSAIGGDELSPVPEATDDMIANNSAANRAAPAAPAAPPVRQLPRVAPEPQGR